MTGGAFRFAYFTEKYEETCSFYEERLGFHREHSWDRNADDKGALFQVGAGLVEVLQQPRDEGLQNAGLDYRSPGGVFMCIQVDDVDDRCAALKSAGVPFAQEITEQAWGHRSFSVVEPNGLVLFFYQEQC